jgi:hypothetical protein
VQLTRIDGVVVGGLRQVGPAMISRARVRAHVLGLDQQPLATGLTERAWVGGTTRASSRASGWSRRMRPHVGIRAASVNGAHPWDATVFPPASSGSAPARDAAPACGRLRPIGGTDATKLPFVMSEGELRFAPVPISVAASAALGHLRLLVADRGERTAAGYQLRTSRCTPLDSPNSWRARFTWT